MSTQSIFLKISYQTAKINKIKALMFCVKMITVLLPQMIIKTLIPINDTLRAQATSVRRYSDPSQSQSLAL